MSGDYLVLSLSATPILPLKNHYILALTRHPPAAILSARARFRAVRRKEGKWKGRGWDREAQREGYKGNGVEGVFFLLVLVWPRSALFGTFVYLRHSRARSVFTSCMIIIVSVE